MSIDQCFHTTRLATNAYATVVMAVSWPCFPYSQAHRKGEPVAVIRRGPDSDQLLIEHPLVALHDQLVRTADEVDLVGLLEATADVPAKQIPRTSRA